MKIIYEVLPKGVYSIKVNINGVDTLFVNKR